VKKLVKLGRYLAGLCGPSDSARLFWHVGTPNFGDDINPALFSLLGDRPMRLQTNRARPHFLGMGSILEKATAHSIVLGSGFLRPPAAKVVTSARIVAVRGKLSREALGAGDEILLGDPMVLLDHVFRPAPGKRHALGVVPHVSEVAAFRRRACPGLRVIDPAESPWKVVEAIASCERIMSQSLHGLIVADALGVPNLWLAPSASMAGGEFKFHDYFSTLDSPKLAHAPAASLLSAPPSDLFTTGRYLFDKAGYLEAIRKAVVA
jgi:hypothetical protein